MFIKSNSFSRVPEMGCCGCFGLSFSRKPKKLERSNKGFAKHISQEFLLDREEEEEEEDGLENGEFTDSGDRDVIDAGNGDEGEYQSPVKRSEEILMYRIQNGLICREIPVKETSLLIRSEVSFSMNSVVLCLLCKMIPSNLHIDTSIAVYVVYLVAQRFFWA